MSISSRDAQIAMYRRTEAQITALFAVIIERLTGILERQARDGLIPLQRADAVRAIVREAVQSYFVRPTPVTGVDAQDEREHLDNLLALARNELRGAGARDEQRLLGRLSQLADRHTALIVGGLALWAFDRTGQAQAEYARILWNATYTITAATVEAHADMMRATLAEEPVLTRLLQGAARPSAASQYGSVLTWADDRGYRLSDRIWNVSEATTARIDAIVYDGIKRGRAAVDIAKDLERFLSPSRRRVKTLKPYGVQGSFDARRLARTEITRAHALATHEAGLANPFVVRVRYHLSRSHDPANCDGTCDQHYAADQANGGFEPGMEPLPVIDTHPQCLCFNTNETGDVIDVIETLRMPGQPAPFTPLAIGPFVAWLMGIDNATPAATAA